MPRGHSHARAHAPRRVAPAGSSAKSLSPRCDKADRTCAQPIRLPQGGGGGGRRIEGGQLTACRATHAPAQTNDPVVLRVVLHVARCALYVYSVLHASRSRTHSHCVRATRRACPRRSCSPCRSIRPSRLTYPLPLGIDPRVPFTPLTAPPPAAPLRPALPPSTLRRAFICQC